MDGWRCNLVTKEVMKDFYKEKMAGTQKRADSYFPPEESVQDDLETFFEKLKIGKEEREDIATYFLPKLTHEEMELVEMKDQEHLHEYVWHFVERPVDVDAEEFEKSESDSKYVRAKCVRYTFLLTKY